MSVSLAAITAFAIGIAATWLVRTFAPRWGLVDRPSPDPLKIHASPIPLGGGGAIAVATIAGVAIAVGLPDVLTLWVVGTALAMSLLGLADDRRPLPAIARLVAQLIAATGLGVLAAIHAGKGATAALVCAALIAGAINATNMQDGMDGLAAGIAALSAGAQATAAGTLGRPALLILAAALCAALVGFLIFNFPPASIFMGDQGSYFIGTTLGGTAVALWSAHPTTAVFVGAVLTIGLPLGDLAIAVMRRATQRGSPFQGDRAHYYDRLMQRAMSQRKVLVLSYPIQALCVAAGAAIITMAAT